MRMIQLRIAALALVVAAGAVVLHASDWNAVYAKVDKVVLEPNPQAPQAIQVWGVFSLAKPNDRNDYLPPARGYLYFKLPAANASTALKEWTDFKDVAGTGQIVSFGSRYELKARLRQSDERPESPDVYSLNTGLTKVRDKTDYSPVRALLDFRD